MPFKNDPATGVKIEKWTTLGFTLSHPSFPKPIWVDFHQLPLDSLEISYGIIKNPITFVEEIMQHGRMVLLRADTFDYLELLEDKKAKDESRLYKFSELKPGDRVISSLCREGNVMVYMGTYYVAEISSYRNYGWSYSDRKEYYYLVNPVKRAFFAYENAKGYSIQEYALQNKVIKEVYRASDKEKGEDRIEEFANAENNLEFVRNLFYKNDSWKLNRNYIGNLKEDIVQNSIEYFGKRLGKEIYLDKSQAVKAANKR